MEEKFANDATDEVVILRCINNIPYNSITKTPKLAQLKDGQKI